ncbi:hypothetical protein ACJ72_01261 [Emergomyces africanus]|uniref:Uncharacterized protein n=1 Tax=Emergomyces africanus TaxID=1955775 RepID=A0A1B7P5V8_9EURO|nr:hypothetical protein ACJ72_01261 [Emergomyces africanus]
MYRDSDGTLFLRMEFLKRRIFWKSFGEGSQMVVFAGMRSLPSPGFYDGVTKDCIPHHLFYTQPKDQKISGPFNHEDGLNRVITTQLRIAPKPPRVNNTATNLISVSAISPGYFQTIHQSFLTQTCTKRTILIHKTSKYLSRNATMMLYLWTGKTLDGIQATGITRFHSPTFVAAMTGRQGLGALWNLGLLRQFW